MKLRRTLFIMMFLFIAIGVFAGDLEKKNDTYNLIISTNVLKEETRYTDINSATLEEFSNAGITMKQAKLIIKYREKTGGFKNIQELKRIKGIGQVTYEKLKSKLVVKTPAERKPLYINEATDEEMKLFGLDKKQIKKIRTYINKNGRISNNLELMKLLPESTYEKYKTVIKYDKF